MSDAAIAIRPARVDDLHVIVQFNQAMAMETEKKSLADAVIIEGVRRLLADERRGRYFIAEIDGLVVGQTMVTREWSDWRNGDFWWIQSVYVLPEFRRRGVFRALHMEVREAARKCGDVCGLRLYVYEQNGRAMEAYQNLGMVRTHYAMFEEDWTRTKN
jgi:GNAT superfamily N-acetyltransferase